MTEQAYSRDFGGTAAENYQRYFVPSIGAPVANDLIAAADPQPGERVLDVACGTGVVTRLAAQMVGAGGRVVGLDVNPGMLAVAHAETPGEVPVEWCEASAESMPLEDEAFDVALCQMGFQFIPNKLAALREIHRVLAAGGRAYLNVPGPKPPLFGIMADGMARHLSREAAGFAELVFSLHDRDELAELLRSAGFRDVHVQAAPKTLHLPAPEDFLWQYIYSTPVAETAKQVQQDQRDALEREVCDRWQQFVVDGGLSIQVGITTASAVK